MKVAAQHENLTQAQVSMIDALESLLCEVALPSIDVKQLCERAHVARSTFYAYYRNLDELMEQLEDIHVSRLSSMNEWVVSWGEKDTSSSGAYGPTLDYLEENSSFFYAELITHRNGRLSEKWKDAKKVISLSASKTRRSSLDTVIS